MASLFSVAVEGKKSRRSCTAACYNAKNTPCACVCNGLNHQKGLQVAVNTTRQLMDVYTRIHQGVKFSNSVLQVSMDEIPNLKEEI